MLRGIRKSSPLYEYLVAAINESQKTGIFERIIDVARIILDATPIVGDALLGAGATTLSDLLSDVRKRKIDPRIELMLLELEYQYDMLRQLELSRIVAGTHNHDHLYSPFPETLIRPTQVLKAIPILALELSFSEYISRIKELIEQAQADKNKADFPSATKILDEVIEDLELRYILEEKSDISIKEPLVELLLEALNERIECHIVEGDARRTVDRIIDDAFKVYYFTREKDYNNQALMTTAWLADAHFMAGYSLHISEVQQLINQFGGCNWRIRKRFEAPHLIAKQHMARSLNLAAKIIASGYSARHLFFIAHRDFLFSCTYLDLPMMRWDVGRIARADLDKGIVDKPSDQLSILEALIRYYAKTNQKVVTHLIDDARAMQPGDRTLLREIEIASGCLFSLIRQVKPDTEEAKHFLREVRKLMPSQGLSYFEVEITVFAYLLDIASVLNEPLNILSG